MSAGSAVSAGSTAAPVDPVALTATGCAVTLRPGLLDLAAEAVYMGGQCGALAVALGYHWGNPVLEHWADGKLEHVLAVPPEGPVWLADCRGAFPLSWYQAACVGPGHELRPRWPRTAAKLYNGRFAAGQQFPPYNWALAATFVPPVVARVDRDLAGGSAGWRERSWSR